MIKVRRVMDKELRILILDDVPADAELEEHELRKAGLVFTSKVVDTKEAFLEELDEFVPDIILSDYDLPTFDGLAALRIAKKKCPDVPFILVTWKLGEEFAIKTLKKGATDYVLKDNLQRLVIAVKRALEETKLITERKLAEARLKQSEEKFRSLAEQFPNMIFINYKGRVVYANKKCEEVMGYTTDEFYTERFDFRSLIAPEYLDQVSSSFQKHMQGYEVLPYEYVLLTKDGKRIEVIITTKLIDYENGKAILGIITEITERKQAEKLMGDALAFNKTIFEASPIGIITYKASGQCVSANESIAKMVGATVDQLLKQNFYHLESWKKSGMLELAEEVLATGMKKTEDVRLISTFGKDVWFVCRFVPFQYGDEPHLLALFTDITQRKESEQVLKETEQKLRNIVEHSNELYYIHDTNQVLSYVSPQSLQVLGYTPDEIMIEWTNLVTDNPINEKGIEITEKALKTGEKQPPYLLELYKKDRSKVLLEIDESPLKDGQGNVIGIAGAARDVTEQKKAEHALRASEAELHDNYFIQSAINMILSESLKNIPLDEILQKALNMILAIPWIAFESMGSISLVADDADILVMKAQSNLPESLKELCAQVPFEKCLCGKAAQSQKIEFADHIDERHEICYEGMHPHGHYSVPILFSGKTLGVLNIYLKEGHIRDKKEEEFLQTVADTLAGIIVRKKAEDRIEYLAYYDGLTGLPNRNLFIDRLTQGIARAEYSKKTCCSFNHGY